MPARVRGGGIGDEAGDKRKPIYLQDHVSPRRSLGRSELTGDEALDELLERRVGHLGGLVAVGLRLSGEQGFGWQVPSQLFSCGAPVPWQPQQLARHA
jgi:hypothetical protein